MLKSLNEKIEILERIEVMEQNLSFDHSDFALEKADGLLNKFESELTDFQRLRLKWLPCIDGSDCDTLVADLLPKTQTAFDIATIFLVMDFCNDDIRKAVIVKYKELFAKALYEKNEAELSSLLSYASIWNVQPSLRSLLVELECQVSDLPLLHPIK